MAGTAPAVVSRSRLLSELAQNSVKEHFYIEYQRFLSNHFCHAAIALYHLGDTPDHFTAYLEKYKRKLESPEGPSFQKQGDVSEEQVREVVGKRRGYYQILAHYEKTLREQFGSNFDRFLEHIMDKLLLGSFASALHPLIHTGYAYNVGDIDRAMEGVAYMHHSYYSFKFDESKIPALTQLGKGTKSTLEVLQELSKDDALYEAMLAAPKPRNLGMLQDNLMALMDHKANELAQYAFLIKLPEDVISPEQILYWALDQALTLYTVSAQRNDFVFIHAVTASWALTNFFHAISDRTKLLMLRSMLCAVLAVYLVQGRPGINASQLEEPDVAQLSWDAIRHRALALDIEGTDEHVYKLVQVCYCLANNSKATSNDLYKRAALTALDYPLVLRSGTPKK